jgi:Flp pilus assembly protein TadD
VSLQVPRALRHLRRAVELAACAKFYHSLGKAHHAAGQWQHAAVALRRAVRDEPESLAFRMSLVKSLVQGRALEEAAY